MESCEDRDQCWALLVQYLPARDLICLSLSSRSIMSRLSSTPGLWQQACQACMCWPPAGCSSAQQIATARIASRTAAVNGAQTAAVTDVQARAMLFAVTAVAQSVKEARSPPPQTVQIPPWLPGQPGISRGFQQADCSSLEPPLLLDSTQVHWLAYGSLSGHTSGVFISTCSSSPRSHRPCAFMAAVVCNKILVAELYIPRSSTPPDPWAGILTTAACRNSSSSSSSGGCGTHSVGAAVPVELWLSSAVQLAAQQQPPAGARSGSGVAAGGSRGSRAGSRQRRGGGANSRGGSRNQNPTWREVHKLVSDCIADNASRCRAVKGTTVIPPGIPAAAAIEQQLAQLAAVSGPVLDLRRLQWDVATSGLNTLHTATPSAAEAAGMASTAAQGRGLHLRQHLVGSMLHSAPLVQSDPSAGTAGGWGWGWQADASMRVQAALAVQCATHVAAAAEQAATDGIGTPAADIGASEADRPELLARLVEQLADLVPDVQLLVLPVLLPSGRAAQRIPSVGGSRLSAPKLLCLNVPFLVQLRKHVWERMPQLRHVLLMAGKPRPLASTRGVEAQQQDQGGHHDQHWHKQQHKGPGCSCSVADMHAGEGCSWHLANGVVPGQLHQQVPGQHLVQGTLTLQELEQRLQQQLHVGDGPVPTAGDLLGGQLQHVWDPEQQDKWFEQQVAEQNPRRAKPGIPASSSNVRLSASVHCNTVQTCGTKALVAAHSTGDGSEQEPALSRAAVDALHDMVHSCMDRSC